VPTSIIKILEGLGFIMQENYRRAALTLAHVSPIEESAFSHLVTGKDLAFYVTLCSLITLNRKEMREHILSSSRFKSMMETVPEISDILEHFLNGRYVEF